MPVSFGVSSNVVWRTPLPPGNSSPGIWADRIFLTSFEEGQLLTLCLDRDDGRVLWKRSLTPGKIERGAQQGNPATATPTADGTHVFVYFGAFGLACYELDGVERWRKPLAIPVTQHGSGTSPVLAGDYLILNCDQDVDSYLIAVDKSFGRTIWRTPRAEFRRGFSTPLPYPPERPELLIVPGTLRLVAYDLKDGSERWTVRGLANEMVPSPVTGDGLIFVAGWTPGSGAPTLQSFDALLAAGDQNQDGKLTREEAPAGPARQHFVYIDADKDGFVTREEWESMSAIFNKSQNVMLAVKPGGTGDVTATHVVWKQTRGLPYCPSPLYHGGRIYLVKNGGLASCFDARTGKVFYQEERLGTVGDFYASPIAADDKICVISQPGTIVIYRASETLEVLSRNSLNEIVVATPALIDATLYIRTRDALWAFRETAISPAP